MNQLIYPLRGREGRLSPMGRRRASASVAVIAAVCACAPADASVLPDGFEEARGGFTAGGGGRTVALERGRVELRAPRRPALWPGEQPDSLVLVLPRSARPVGEDPMPIPVRRLAGRESRRVRLFRAVRYPDAWPGVDVVFHRRRGQLEYDLELERAPAAARVALRWQGATSVEVAADGGVVVGTPAGPLVQEPPIALQRGRAVPVRFAVAGDTLRLRLGRHDPASPLVVDPVLRSRRSSAARGSTGQRASPLRPTAVPWSWAGRPLPTFPLRRARRRAGRRTSTTALGPATRRARTASWHAWTARALCAGSRS